MTVIFIVILTILMAARILDVNAVGLLIVAAVSLFVDYLINNN